MSGNTARLLCFGLGYSARVLAARLRAQGWDVIGTSRAPPAPSVDGIPLVRFARDQPIDPAVFAGVTHVLSSVAPDGEGDPVLGCHADALAALTPRWTGYLSTTGVYGDHGGAWVDEDTPVAPDLERADRRVAAERAWLALGARAGCAVHIFRLAGIYGPGRSALDAVRSGRAQRVYKPGQVFSRIHVDDIATVLQASIAAPNPGRIYNVCDDEPAPPQDVTAFACALLGLPEPPLVALDQAELSPMARSFYRDNRRVSNRRIHDELAVTLAYPTYREGLRNLARQLAG